MKKFTEFVTEGKNMTVKHTVVYTDTNGQKREVVKYGMSDQKAMAHVQKLPDFKSHHHVRTTMVPKLSK
jgi:hypothetical protein